MDKRTVTRVRTPSGAGVVLLVLAAAAWAVSASGACVPSPAGLVGWWPGEGNANDIIGTDNGILQGGATANAAGEVGQAFSLDGTNSYVQISDNAALRPTNLTVEAWVLFRSLNSAGNATAGQQYIVFKQNTRSSNFEGYYLAKERRSGGDVFVFDVSSAAGQVVEVASSPMIATGVWYHVAAMRGSNFIQLFVNGQSVAQATVSFAQDYGNFPLYFGTSGQSYWDRKFSGLLDEVSLYNRALSSTEVAAIYSAGAAGKCRGPQGPSIVTPPQSQSVAVGSNAFFTVKAAGTAPLSYQWVFNGAPLSDGTQFSGTATATLWLTNAQPANTGNYTVVVTNLTGSVTSAVGVLTVLAPPSLTAQPQSSTNVAGTTASFSATAAGSAPLVYQWKFNGGNLANGGRISGATSNTLTITGVQPTDAGNYTLVVTNAVGAVTSSVAILAVLGPPVITVPPASQTVAAGTTLSLSVSASGTLPLSYQWLFNGAALSDGTQFSGTATPTLWLTNAQPANAGGYSVVVTNVVGSVTSAVATLTVNMVGACVPPPAGLVGWWPGEGSAADIVSTNNGILQGGATANAAGEVGQAFSFDGTNGYVQIPDSSAFHLATLTVECWVRFDAYQTPGSSAYPYQQYIVFKQNSQSYEFEGFALTKDHDPQGDVILWEVASPTHELIRIDSVNTVVTGAWYHLAGVRGSNYTQLYLNGHLEAQANVNFPQDYGTFPLYFGTSGQSYYDRKLHGELDEVSLYNRALSASEIAAIYAAGSAGKCRPGAPAVVSQLASLLGPPLMPAGRPTLASGPTVPGGFPLVIAGQPRHPCVIEMSDDLVHWSTFTNVTLLPDGTARISAPMTASRQYYRAKLLP